MKAGILQQYNMVFCGQGGWHKRVYHMHSDVIFCWVLWIWLSSWNFCLIFWFYFRNRLKMLYFDFFRVRLKICRGSSSAQANFKKKWKYNIFNRLRKQNQNIQTKVPTTQPNPQYSAKNNVTIHMIYTFMPPPLQQTTMLHCYRYT